MAGSTHNPTTRDDKPAPTIYRGHDITTYRDAWGGWVWDVRNSASGALAASGIGTTQSKAEDAAMNAVDKLKRGEG